MNQPKVRWAIWVVLTIAWTAGLTAPITGPAFGDTDEMRNLTRVIIAKTAHLCVYALWAYLTGWLQTPLRVRIFLLMFLMAHAVGTEWTQLYVRERSGSLRDAAIDHLGVLIGVCASLRWWTAPDALSSPLAPREESDDVKSSVSQS